jgi:hypothetical protein
MVTTIITVMAAFSNKRVAAIVYYMYFLGGLPVIVASVLYRMLTQQTPNYQKQ